MRLRGAQRGDTIIEVIFAIVIFAFIAIISITIMNQGIATGERALEITLVRQQINAQAEALRFVHASSVAGVSEADTVWNLFKSTASGGYGQSSASAFGVQSGRCRLPAGRPFVMNARTGEVWNGTLTIEPGSGANVPPYPQVVYNDDTSPVKNDPGVRAAYGMWVEAVPSNVPVSRQFIDFHIRACWSVPGSNMPMALGTIVRLYDPL